MRDVCDVRTYGTLLMISWVEGGVIFPSLPLINSSNDAREIRMHRVPNGSTLIEPRRTISRIVYSPTRRYCAASRTLSTEPGGASAFELFLFAFPKHDISLPL